MAHLCLVANSSADSPTSRDLAPELSVVARKGAKPVDSLEGVSAELPTLLRLPIVKDRAKSELPPALLEALVEVLTEAVDRLGQSPRGDAARILLGLDPYSLHLTLKRRSEKAVIALYPGDETKKELSRKDKEMLLLGVADELRGMDEAHGEEGSPVGGSESATVVARQPSAATDSPQRAAVVVATDRRRPHRSGRRFVWVGVLAVIGAAAAAGVMAASRGSTPAPGLVLSETFSERDRGWTDDATFKYDDGTYVGVLPAGRAGGKSSRAPVATDQLPPNVRTSVVARKTSETRGGSFGLFCRDTGGLRYGARIDSDAQSYTIYKIEVSGEREQTMVPREFNGNIARSGSNTIALECTGDPGGNKPVALALFVNGERVGGTVDPVGYSSGQVGLEIASGTEGVEVRFDNLVISRA